VAWIGGVSIRVHLFTVVFGLFMLVWSILPSQMGIDHMMLAMASLFVVVLAHEAGHLFACRWAGGESDRMVLLPFGGLALGRPPDRWQAHLLTAAGGPAVSLILALLLAGGLVLAGLGDHVAFNPLAPAATLAAPDFHASSTALALAKVGLWWLYYTDILILVINTLIPAYPLDGGRIVQASLWSRLGYRRATEAAALVGFVASALVGALGLASNQAVIVLMGALSMWACWMERRRVRGADELTDSGLGIEAGAGTGSERTGSEMSEAEVDEAGEQAEVDRILAKIGARGMSSLTGRERKALDRATRKRRGE